VIAVLPLRDRDRAREHLLSQMPADKREEIEKQMFSVSQNPYKLIEEQLGVPFFDNLQKIAKARLAGMSDRAAVVYLGTICEGVSKKHPQIRDTFIPWLIERTVGYSRWKILAEIDHPIFYKHESVNCSCNSIRRWKDNEYDNQNQSV
jgi:hypothetical protein